MSNRTAVVIKKVKKGGHGGHHGGAWKVAYADFVTAMMALFIVLWLLSSTSKQTQEQIAGYFNDPRGTASKKGSEGKPTSKAQGQAQHSPNLDALKQQLLRAIQDVNLLNKLRRQIEISVTDEGLRVDLIEDKNGTFFELGSAKPTAALQEILRVISEELKEVPNGILIEGHTDAQPYAAHAGYDNWDLSSDRANEARREMRSDGIHASQVYEVCGFADHHLRLPDKPDDPANRRVSIVVQPAAAGPEDQTLAAKRPERNIAESSPASPDSASKPAVETSEQEARTRNTKSLGAAAKKEDRTASVPTGNGPGARVLQKIKKIFERLSEI